MKKLLLLILVFFVSCNDAKDNLLGSAQNEIKTEQKETELEKKIKEKEAKNKEINNIKILTDKNEILTVNKENFKDYQETLEKKDVKKIENTLSKLEVLDKQVKETKKEGNSSSSVPQNEINKPFIDEFRNIFTSTVNNYSLRHLNFEITDGKPVFNTITFQYENLKKRISFEIVDKNNKYLDEIKKDKKDFFNKSYKIGNIDLYLSINTKLNIINGVFEYSDYSFIITTEAIGESEIIIETVKAINYDLFSKLKVKYEQK